MNERELVTLKFLKKMMIENGFSELKDGIDMVIKRIENLQFDNNKLQAENRELKDLLDKIN